MTISANGAFAGPCETVPLPEYEAAFLAACRLDDEGVAVGPRRALEVLEVSNDVSFRDPGVGRELVGSQRTALERVAKRLAVGFVTGWHLAAHGKCFIDGRRPAGHPCDA